MIKDNDVRKVADFLWEITRRNKDFCNEVHERFGGDYEKVIWDPKFSWRWSSQKVYDPNLSITDIYKLKRRVTFGLPIMHPIRIKDAEQCINVRQDNSVPEKRKNTPEELELLAKSNWVGEEIEDYDTSDEEIEEFKSSNIDWEFKCEEIEISNKEIIEGKPIHSGNEHIFPHSENPNVVLKHNRERKLELYVDSISVYLDWIDRYDRILKYLQENEYKVAFQDGAYMLPKGFKIIDHIPVYELDSAVAEIEIKDEEKKRRLKDKYQAPKGSVADRGNDKVRKEYQRSCHSVASLIKHTPHLLSFIK